MSDQLELFTSEPFSVRLPIREGMAFFREHYWDALPKGKVTRKACIRIVRYFVEQARLSYVDEIAKVHVEDFVTLLSASLKPATINTHLMILTLWFNKLFEWKEVGVYHGLDFRPIPLPAKNPGEMVPKFAERPGGQAWPKKVVYRFIDAATYMGDLDMAEDIEMMYLTSHHPIDHFNITDKNVDLAHMILTGIQHKSINARKKPSGEPYLIAITPRMETILRRRLAATPSGEPLFRPMTMTELAFRRKHNKRFSAIRNYLKMPHVQIRHMRHSGTTLLLDNNVDIETVRERGGWTTHRQMKVYGQRKIVHQRRAQEILEDKNTEILQ